jgi:hypothetical protein
VQFLVIWWRAMRTREHTWWRENENVARKPRFSKFITATKHKPSVDPRSAGRTRARSQATSPSPSPLQLPHPTADTIGRLGRGSILRVTSLLSRWEQRSPPKPYRPITPINPGTGSGLVSVLKCQLEDVRMIPEVACKCFHCLPAPQKLDS